MYMCAQRLILTDSDSTYNGTMKFLDDEPPDPDQGLEYTGGWKLCSDLVLHGDRNYEGTSQFAKNQIYLVKHNKYRKGDATDYIEIEKDEDRQLRNMKSDRMYLIWWQNLMPPEEFTAAKMKENALAKKKPVKKKRRK
jgi:hypothetical protein